MNKAQCDLCGDNYLVEPVHKMAAFRGVKNLCYSHGIKVEIIRSSHAHDAYRYGKSDWYERLKTNVRKSLKKYYRSFGT